MATIEDFRAWYDRDLSRFAPWGGMVQVSSTADIPGHRELHIRIFTDNNRYAIRVREPEMRKAKTHGAPGVYKKLSVSEAEEFMRSGNWFVDLAPDGRAIVYPASLEEDGGYLGCIATSRRPRAGEEHCRGNDLADGTLSEETWHRILGDIVSFELVSVAKSARQPAVVIGGTGLDAISDPAHLGG